MGILNPPPPVYQLTCFAGLHRNLHTTTHSQTGPTHPPASSHRILFSIQPALSPTPTPIYGTAYETLCGHVKTVV